MWATAALALSKAVQATGEALAEISESIDVTVRSVPSIRSRPVTGPGANLSLKIQARSDLVDTQLGLQELAQPASQYAVSCFLLFVAFSASLY